MRICIAKKCVIRRKYICECIDVSSFDCVRGFSYGVAFTVIYMYCGNSRLVLFLNVCCHVKLDCFCYMLGF